MDEPIKLRGVQFISYADMARDIRAWAPKLPADISAVAGLPRSGLTAAHMLAAELNVPAAMQIHGRYFRQSTGRPLTKRSGRVLVVDDTSSVGTAMREARRQLAGMPAYFGAVYARVMARPVLDVWHKLHAEPDWLVVTQWNLLAHQGSRWIVAEREALTGAPHAELAGIVSSRETGRSLADLYADYPNAALLLTETDHDAREVAEQTGRATVSVEAWQAYATGWPASSE